MSKTEPTAEQWLLAVSSLLLPLIFLALQKNLWSIGGLSIGLFFLSGALPELLFTVALFWLRTHNRIDSYRFGILFYLLKTGWGLPFTILLSVVGPGGVALTSRYLTSLLLVISFTRWRWQLAHTLFFLVGMATFLMLGSQPGMGGGELSGLFFQGLLSLAVIYSAGIWRRNKLELYRRVRHGRDFRGGN